MSERGRGPICRQQKLQGKPTSDELLTHEALRKAWDADGIARRSAQHCRSSGEHADFPALNPSLGYCTGSPFKGTQFDPTAVNITGSGSGPSPGTSLGTACPPG